MSRKERRLKAAEDAKCNNCESSVSNRVCLLRDDARSFDRERLTHREEGEEEKKKVYVEAL